MLHLCLSHRKLHGRYDPQNTRERSIYISETVYRMKKFFTLSFPSFFLSSSLSLSHTLSLSLSLYPNVKIFIPELNLVLSLSNRLSLCSFTTFRGFKHSEIWLLFHFCSSYSLKAHFQCIHAFKYSYNWFIFFLHIFLCLPNKLCVYMYVCLFFNDISLSCLSKCHWIKLIFIW